jgi:hypothetical protein
MNAFLKKTLVVAVLVGTAACQDLEVPNLNLPDTERALSTPDAVQAVIETSFSIWWGRIHGASDAYWYFPAAANEVTHTVISRSVQASFEPRLELNNDPVAASVWIPRSAWDGFASGAANANDGLRIIEDGMRIEVADAEEEVPTDQTDRAYSFAKIFQGINLGYMGLVFDQSAPATEETVIDDAFWEADNLKPYPEVVAMGVRSLEEGIERAQTGAQWLTKPSFIHTREYNNEQMIKFAHTMIARLLIYQARTPEEREQVDWQKVLQHTERGLDFDFEVTLESGIITSGFSYYVGQLGGTSTSSMRVDPHVLGMADVSGNYQAWLATDRDERDGFQITTPDLRFQGPAGPTAAGAYFQYRSGWNTVADRGLYNRASYGWYRRTHYGEGQWNNGFLRVASADENRLYRAEALLRTGNLQGAADLINVSRTRGVRIGSTQYPSNLPPVTAQGVPQSDDCVPRTKTGACGSLLDALRYERTVELFAWDAYRAWFDYRGFGMLPTGQAYHMPIPGRYLVSIGLPLYTFGGVGGDGAAS